MQVSCVLHVYYYPFVCLIGNLVLGEVKSSQRNLYAATFPKFGIAALPPLLAPLLSSRSAGCARASRGSARDTVSQGLRRARPHSELALFRDLARYPWRLTQKVQQRECISAGNPPKPNKHEENE